MEIRFQKRANHYISFEGNYTLSKATDDSSAGFNAFVGTLNAGNVQELDRLKLEHGISANDATNRFVLAAIVDLPVGRGLWIGRDMNRVLDGFVGGWEISTLITRQTGQPLAFSTSEGANGAFIDGNQRPNIVCNAYQLGSGISYHQAAANGLDDAANPFGQFKSIGVQCLVLQVSGGRDSRATRLATFQLCGPTECTVWTCLL